MVKFVSANDSKAWGTKFVTTVLHSSLFEHEKELASWYLMPGI